MYHNYDYNTYIQAEQLQCLDILWNTWGPLTSRLVGLEPLQSCCKSPPGSAAHYF